MDRNNTVFGHFHAVANFHAAQPVTGRNYQFTGATSFPEQSDDRLNISFRDALREKSNNTVQSLRTRSGHPPCSK